jgi:hypothetical protein
MPQRQKSEKTICKTGDGISDKEFRSRIHWKPDFLNGQRIWLISPQIYTNDKQAHEKASLGAWGRKGKAQGGSNSYPLGWLVSRTVDDKLQAVQKLEPSDVARGNVKWSSRFDKVW